MKKKFFFYGSFLIGMSFFSVYGLSSKPVPSPIPPTLPSQEKESIVREVPPELSTVQHRLSFSPILKKVSPAVVSIHTHQGLGEDTQAFFDDDFPHFFFGEPFNKRIPPHSPGVSHSMGSGVIVDKNGIIITCAHVIQNSQNIKVKLSDNREFTAKAVLIDKNMDLAALKIEDQDLAPGEALPFVPLGKSGNLEVGDVVFAVGNPFGVGQSVTNGIVSALSRNVGGRILIQTDAPINPGNSGGALIDSTGELIAIPNAILSRTGGSHGIGFAIPSSVLKPLINAAQTGKKVQHPWDGLLLQTLTPDKAESFGMKDGRGALVVNIQEGSPAGQKGLKIGDVIREVNGVSIDSAEDYVIKMQDVEIGSPVSLIVFTKDGDRNIQFLLGSPPLIPAPDETILSGKHLLTQLKVANLSPALAVDNGFPVDRKGVVILGHSDNKESSLRDLWKGSQGGLRLGRGLALEPGDVIDEVGGQKIQTVQDLKKAVTKTYSTVLIRRGKQKIQIATRRGWS